MGDMILIMLISAHRLIPLLCWMLMKSQNILQWTQK